MTSTNMMNGLITINDVKGMQFYKMPKCFFHDSAYTSLKCESKLAYMLLLDLLPLSVANNWVNEDNEVFVKMSRDKLMALLNIRGTQKAAQIMRELVDYGLIVYKRVGLSSCNEIYLYHSPCAKGKGPDPKDKKEPEEEVEKEVDKVDKEVEKPAPVLEPDLISRIARAEEMDEIEDLLENDIHMEDLRQKYNPILVNEIGNNVVEMFFNERTVIGGQSKPMVIMRSFLRKLRMYHIEYVIDQFMAVSGHETITNSKRYLQTLIYNSIFEANTKMIANINYHMGC